MRDVVETLTLLGMGTDFTDPAKLVSRIPARTACLKPDGFPYSIAMNLRHTNIWNEVWLARLKGLPRVNPYPDFPDVSEEEWPSVRGDLLRHIEDAMFIACAEPFVHHCKSDESARKLLLRIAVHTSYHLGQINLLKRLLRARKNQ